MARVKYEDMIQFEDELVNKHKLFEGLTLEPMETYMDMDTSPAVTFKTPMASGFYKPYTIQGSDKIEKIVVGELHYMRRAKYCLVNMTASDDYDLPIFAFEFDETAARVGATVDLMPLMDIAVHPEYREKYLDPMADIWRKYSTIPGITVEGRCLLQRRYGPWPWARESLSPYPLDGLIPEPEDRMKIIEATAEYGKLWLKLLKEAKPVQDPAYKAEMLKRKRVIQKIYRDRDPGGEVLKKIFGEELHRLFVSLAF